MLAAAKFNGTKPSTGFTFPPEMTSPATSGRQQITQTCKFLVMFESRFLDRFVLEICSHLIVEANGNKKRELDHL